MASGSASKISSSVKAWDWPTRAFHWTLVFCVISAWASFKLADRIGDPTLVWHRWNGYAILVLVVFRIIWGFAGSSTSRFTAFVTWPWTALRYGLDLFSDKKRHFLGHNPMGSWMILMLLSALLIQGGLGLFSLEHNELVAGPLKRLIAHETSEKVTKLHVQGINVIFALVAMHITANVLYGWLKKDKLIKAMVTGEKPAEAYEDAPEMTPVSNVTLRAAVCLGAAIVIVFGGITLLGGRIL
ncbi:MAG: cytochrome b/b6 domain-containing protein [Beijerinckiaceae bacterium]